MASRAVVTMSRAITSWHVAVRWVSFALAIAEENLSATTDDLLNSSSRRTSKLPVAAGNFVFHCDPAHTSTVRMHHTSSDCCWSLYTYRSLICLTFRESYFQNFRVHSTIMIFVQILVGACYCESWTFVARADLSLFCVAFWRASELYMFGRVSGRGFESENTTK